VGAGILGVVRRGLRAAQVFPSVVRQLAAKFGLGRSRFTTLYRAVTDTELDDIVRTQAFRNPVGIEVKYFAMTTEGASSYAKAAGQAFGDGPFTIVETRIPTALITAEMRAVVDRGISTVTVPTNLLRRLSTPKIWNYAPVP